jgi:hypothetical protein
MDDSRITELVMLISMGLARLLSLELFASQPRTADNGDEGRKGPLGLIVLFWTLACWGGFLGLLRYERV